MVRPTDQEKTATEKIVCCSQFSRGEGTQGTTRESQKAKGVRCLYCGPHRKSKGGYAVLRLASLSNFSRLWDLGTICIYLMPVPKKVRPEEYCLRVRAW